MRPDTVRPLAPLVQRGLIAALLVLAVVGWAVTDERMAGMDAGPGTDPGALGFYITAWVVMMAAMMFPSIAPMVLMYARIQEGKRERGQIVQAVRRRCSSPATWSPGRPLASSALC